jgi:hypothetical protein
VENVGGEDERERLPAVEDEGRPAASAAAAAAAATAGGSGSMSTAMYIGLWGHRNVRVLMEVFGSTVTVQ